MEGEGGERGWFFFLGDLQMEGVCIHVHLQIVIRGLRLVLIEPTVSFKFLGPARPVGFVWQFYVARSPMAMDGARGGARARVCIVRCVVLCGRVTHNNDWGMRAGVRTPRATHAHKCMPGRDGSLKSYLRPCPATLDELDELDFARDTLQFGREASGRSELQFFSGGGAVTIL